MKELDWANLPFGYMKTDYNVRIYYRNEQWGALEVCSEETIPMHMAATCLHYGQEAFEGLKASVAKTAKYVFSVWKRMRRVCSLPAVAS